MKKSVKKITSLAMAAAMGFSAIGMTGAAPIARLFADNAIVAEAAAAWYPTSLSAITVNTATNFAALGSTNAETAVKNKLKSALGNAALMTGVYRNYRVVYSTQTNNSYNNVVLMYDPAKHPDLDQAFFGNQLAKGKSWTLRYLQYINTLKQLSGVMTGSKQYLPFILDGYTGSTPVGNSNWNGSCIRLNAGASTGFEAGVAGLSGTFFTWTTLHETAHAYKNANTYKFLSSDDVYCNLRALCAIRALKHNGVYVPQVIRDNNSGPLFYQNKRYESVTAMQYAVKDITSDYNSIAAVSDVNDLSGGHFFYRLGVLLHEGLGIDPWSVAYTNGNTINTTWSSSTFNSGWDSLYALCISDPGYISASFMTNARSIYLDYAETMTEDLTYQYNGVTYTSDMTEDVLMALITKIPFHGAWICSKPLVHGLSSLDLLANRKDSFLNEICSDKIPGNNNITYWQFANKIVQ